MIDFAHSDKPGVISIQLTCDSNVDQVNMEVIPARNSDIESVQWAKGIGPFIEPKVNEA